MPFRKLINENHCIVKDKKLLLIFIKNPEKGTVKTRLAKTVGNEKAYQTYLKLIDYTLEVARQVEARKQIWYSSFVDEEDGLGGPAFEKKVQKGRNLGERMATAFRQGFKDGFEKVLIIGSDCPGITTEIIESAYARLDQQEVVIGPSEDGGYYLVGSKKFIPQIFDNIPWSTESVYPETIRILRDKSLSYSALPTLNDIDTEEDLRNSNFDE